MARYQCSVCGFVYDEDKQGRAWQALPDGWTCPGCGAAKSFFTTLDEPGGSTIETLQLPSTFVTAHRIFGYVFLAIYIFFLWQMVPRLWSYQIEFPARTVVHITLGMAIGATLLLKILIVRFFKRFDATLVPALGTSILVGSVVMIGISAPFAFHEAVMAQASATTGIFTTDNLDRLRTLLAQAGLEEAESGRLATPGSLRAGQAVLRRECVECHDLRTVLAKPRTPQNWRQTVRRMADRTTQLDPLEENEQWLVTAYLIAISPQLQRSAQQMRAQEELGNRAKQAMQAVAHEEVPSAEFDLRQAKGLFETKCSECHETSLVETAPPGSAGEARSLVARMVDEGLTATETELAQLVKYLTTVYAKPVPAARENDR